MSVRQNVTSSTGKFESVAERKMLEDWWKDISRFLMVTEQGFVTQLCFTSPGTFENRHRVLVFVFSPSIPQSGRNLSQSLPGKVPGYINHCKRARTQGVKRGRCAGNLPLCTLISHVPRTLFSLSQLDCFVTDSMQEMTNCLTGGNRQIILQPLTGLLYFSFLKKENSSAKLRALLRLTVCSFKATRHA